MLAKGPGNVRERIRVAAVEKEFVVDRERGGVRLLGREALFEDLFPPIHAHVVMHVAGKPHLVHGCVPVRIVRRSVLELGARVEIGRRSWACSRESGATRQAGFRSARNAR